MLQMPFELIGGNLAHIQPENHQNAQDMSFWQKAPEVNGLKNCPVSTHLCAS